MCGRFAITLPPDAMRRLFGFLDEPRFPPRYNIAPSQPVPIVCLDGGRRRFLLVRWGLVPSWAKDMPHSLLINARAETIAEKPSFRGAFRHRRALMPADGFYEWRTRETGRGPKQPYYIRRKNGAPFAMAAIRDTWMDAHGSELDSCAIVTTEANATLKPIHARMPVILDEKDWARWLDPATPEQELLALLRPAPDDLLEAIPISTRINNTANDDPTVQTREIVAPEPEKPAQKSQAKRPVDTRQIDLF